MHGCAHARARADFPDVAPPDVPEGATYSWTLIGDAFFAIVPLDSRSRTKQDVRCTTAVLIVARRAGARGRHASCSWSSCVAGGGCVHGSGRRRPSCVAHAGAGAHSFATVSCCAAPQWHAMAAGRPQCSLGLGCKAQCDAHAPAPRTCLRAAEPAAFPPLQTLQKGSEADRVALLSGALHALPSCRCRGKRPRVSSEQSHQGEA